MLQNKKMTEVIPNLILVVKYIYEYSTIFIFLSYSNIHLIEKYNK